MAPLFAAVMHGCQAGRYQEALDEVFFKQMIEEKRSLLKNSAQWVRL
jgi:hypothetical protein